MSRRPRILAISYSPLHRDARVLRQLRVLAELGEVTSVGYGPAPDGVAHHVRIPETIVSWHKDRRLLLARRYQATYDTMAVNRFVREHVPAGQHDVVVANDVETVPVAVGLRPRAGVHADLHEYSSRQNEERLAWRLVVGPYVRFLVRRWVTRADSTTTVGPEIATEYRREFGLEPGVVVNAPPYTELSPAPTGSPLRLVHHGNAVPERLETMLAAMERVTTGATLDLYLVDAGDGYVSRLRERYPDGSGSPVRVHDPVPTAEIVRTLHAYDVGVYSLPPVSFNFRYALPNKLFDFVQARLALVVGPSPEMAAVVRGHGLGVVTEDFTPASLATAIDALVPDDVERWKAASAVAARELSAEQQVGAWRTAVERLLARL